MPQPLSERWRQIKRLLFPVWMLRCLDVWTAGRLSVWTAGLLDCWAFSTLSFYPFRLLIVWTAKRPVRIIDGTDSVRFLLFGLLVRHCVASCRSSASVLKSSATRLRGSYSNTV